VEKIPHRAQMMKVSPTEPAPDITFLGDVKIPGPTKFNSVYIKIS
jgi:hypothetical protein